jgi:uncharacterized damage-inducible protein DinB
MRNILGSIESEYHRYKKLGEGAIGQISDQQIASPGPAGGNSVEVLVSHIAGNLISRFTDFLTDDGEKPWRDREGEFQSRQRSRSELLAAWERAWSVLFGAITPLTDEDLLRTVTIRREALTVHDALHRSLAHTAYHVGQIVYLAKALRGEGWQWLSIPPGGSAAYNQNPSRERPRDHATSIGRTSGGS